MWLKTNDGKFAGSSKEWSWKKWILGLIVFGCAFMIFHSYVVMPYLNKIVKPKELSYVAAPIAEAAEVGVDLDAAKEKTIDILEKCESGGHKWDEGFIRLDTNDKLSYGPLQWQKDTVKHYVKVRDGREISGLEAVNIALDRVQSRSLALFVIFETEQGVDKDWVICSRNYQIQARVDLIKELEN